MASVKASSQLTKNSLELRYKTMKQLIEHVQYAIKGALKDDNAQYVLIEHNGKQYTRKVKYKPFSNFPIEYINWNNTTYQVNTVKAMQC